MTRNSFPINSVRRSIERLMFEKDVKPKPLAISLGMGETAIRDIFLDKTKSVGGTKLNALAQHFDVTVESILDGTASTIDQKLNKNSKPHSDNTHINLSVSLPSLDALTDMFSALLETIDVDPAEDERAQRLARSFPSVFEAVLLRSRSGNYDINSTFEQPNLTADSNLGQP